MPPFDRREALRYMGASGEPDAALAALVEEAAALLEPLAHYRVLLCRLPLERGTGLALDGLPCPGRASAAACAGAERRCCWGRPWAAPWMG